LSSGCLDELRGFLKEPSEIKKVDVVVMPDFFLDRLISLNNDVTAFSALMKRVVKRKGGSIDGIRQTELRGGNAINTASALASLNAKVTPIVCTSQLGSQLIRFHLKSSRVDFSHVKILDDPSITTAIEFESTDGKINVMLRDVGALANFGPHHLNNEDSKAIKNADYACVFNWAGTRLFGTELAETVFSHVKYQGKGKTYCDTADPIPNKEEIPELVERVLRKSLVDILSLNENEAICYASQLSDETEELRKKLKPDELAKECARILASHLSSRIDLHTTSFSASFTKKSETVIHAFDVPVLRVTGAGDAWNAGNILGDAYALSDDCRLALANTVAAYYISNTDGKHPTRKQLTKFSEKLKPKI
jgi:sugar/nucleoside kinase (ribokinase family)